MNKPLNGKLISIMTKCKLTFLNKFIYETLCQNFYDLKNVFKSVILTIILKIFYLYILIIFF